MRYGLLVLLASLLAAGAPASEEAPEGRELVQALRGGGFNIYFRHAATDWSQQDHVERPGDWESCDPGKVRQLSRDGRRTSRSVGEHIRALGIPVGRVLASPYCRTMQTAQLMRLGAVEPTTEVMNLRAARFFESRAAIVRRARRLLASTPEQGTNTVIVAHGNVAREATPVYPGEAEAVVFRPLAEGGFRVVQRLDPQAWEQLARQFAVRD